MYHNLFLVAINSIMPRRHCQQDAPSIKTLAKSSEIVHNSSANGDGENGFFCPKYLKGFFMKKYIISTILLFSLLFTGCNEAVETMSLEDYEISEAGTTTKEIGQGSSLEEFLNAYENYEMLIGHEDGIYSVFHKEDIMAEEGKELVFTEKTFSLLLPTFFVDDIACSTDTLCETYQVTKENLLSFLNSEAFLKEHHVVYQIMICDFTDGTLTQLLTSSRDYNEELEN